MSALLKAGTSSLVPALSGDKSSALVNAPSSSSGNKATSATNLLTMIVPLLLSFLNMQRAQRGRGRVLRFAEELPGELREIAAQGVLGEREQIGIQVDFRGGCLSWDLDA